eukprot:5905155-Prymnesium_polylepis.1
MPVASLRLPVCLELLDSLLLLLGARASTELAEWCVPTPPRLLAAQLRRWQSGAGASLCSLADGSAGGTSADGSALVARPTPARLAAARLAGGGSTASGSAEPLKSAVTSSSDDHNHAANQATSSARPWRPLRTTSVKPLRSVNGGVLAAARAHRVGLSSGTDRYTP